MKENDQNIQAAILSDLSLAGIKLGKFRDFILKDIFDEHDIDYWKQNSQKFRDKPSAFSKYNRDKMEKIGKWFDEGESLNAQ